MLANIRTWLRWPAKKQTLNNVDSEQLRRDRIRIEQTELSYTREIEELEKSKEDLFRKGVEGSSDRQRIQLIRKMKQLDAQIQGKDRQLALLSKNLQVLNTIAQIKENERMFQDLGLESVVNSLDLSEVQAYIERATIEGQFQMERFTKLVKSATIADGVYEAEELDSETQAILEIMNASAQHQSDSTIRDGLSRVDQLWHKQVDNS